MRIFIKDSIMEGHELILGIQDNKLIAWLVENVGGFVACSSWLNINGNGWRIGYSATSYTFENPAYYKLSVIFDKPLPDHLVTDFYLRFA